MKQSTSLHGKVIVITGGSLGIGKATASLAGREGTRVILIARGKKMLDGAVVELNRQGFDVHGIPTDVRFPTQVRRAVRSIVRTQGRIDILINNAGVISWGNFLETAEDRWNEEVDTNITGMLNMTYAVVPHMVERKDGVIVNIASGAGKSAYPNIAVYSATKFAVLGFTQAFAQEVAPFGIRVYAVSPGTTKTRMTEFTGMEPGKVAQRILAVAKEEIGLSPGEDSEIYR
jgi:3-oxoacyl-[acyl-carrier protein] reductase